MQEKEISFVHTQAGWVQSSRPWANKDPGRNYRFNQSRPITGGIKTATVRRDALKDIYVTFSCDRVPHPEQAPKTGLTAGADFGLKDFLTLSTGEKIAAPQPLKAKLRHVRKAQRVLSRKQKGSQARQRARLDVARVHKQVANVRNDWQWKQARLLVMVFDLLAFETLRLKAMHQLWGRKVGDLGFADFLLKAQWMAKKLGKDLVKIDCWEPTTKTCHLCGHCQDMPLNVRTFVCGGCGNIECRDVNAAHNILEAGRRLRSGDTRKTSQEASVVITANPTCFSRGSASIENSPRSVSCFLSWLATWSGYHGAQCGR